MSTDSFMLQRRTAIQLLSAAALSAVGGFAGCVGPSQDPPPAGKIAMKRDGAIAERIRDIDFDLGEVLEEEEKSERIETRLKNNVQESSYTYGDFVVDAGAPVTLSGIDSYALNDKSIERYKWEIMRRVRSSIPEARPLYDREEIEDSPKYGEEITHRFDGIDMNRNVDTIAEPGIYEIFLTVTDESGAQHTNRTPVYSSKRITVEQGDRKFSIHPIKGNISVGRLYDYHRNRAHISNPDYIDSDSTLLYFWEGPDDISLVIIHDSVDDSGGEVTFDFSGIPDGSRWVIKDDGPEFESSSKNNPSINWKWVPNKTDGGVLKGGLSSFEINITPRIKSGISEIQVITPMGYGVQGPHLDAIDINLEKEFTLKR